MACGGDDDVPATAAPAQYQPGSVLTLEVASEGQSPNARRWLIHGVTAQGELVAEPSADLIPGALVPLPLPTSDASAERDQAKKAARPTICNNEPTLGTVNSCDYYKRLFDAFAETGLSDPTDIVNEIADLDAGIVDLQIDQARSGLSKREYLAFHQTLDQVPFFAAQEDAEIKAQGFFDFLKKLFTAKPPIDMEEIDAAPNQRQWLDALAAEQLDWRSFLELMAARGDDFMQLRRQLNSWFVGRLAAGVQPTLRGFVADYAHGTPEKAPAATTSPNPDRWLASSSVMDEGSVTAASFVVSRSDWPTLGSGKSSVLSVHDPDESHYNDGWTSLRNVKISLGTTGAMNELEFFLRGAYNVGHPRLAGTWIRNLEFYCYDPTFDPWSTGPAPASICSQFPNLSAKVYRLTKLGTAARPTPYLELRVHMAGNDALMNFSHPVVTFLVNGLTGISVANW